MNPVRDRCVVQSEFQLGGMEPEISIEGSAYFNVYHCRGVWHGGRTPYNVVRHLSSSDLTLFQF